MCIHLESPAPYEPNEQCVQCVQPDSEAWSTNTGKGQPAISFHSSPLDAPREVT